MLLNNTMLGSSRTVLAEQMPAVEPHPPFKAWGYLLRNELAQGVGRQMYYTDKIGISLSMPLFMLRSYMSIGKSLHACNKQTMHVC